MTHTPESTPPASQSDPITDLTRNGNKWAAKRGESA